MNTGAEVPRNPQPVMTTATFKFFWNGIKVNGGKLQKASFSMPKSYATWSGLPDGTITVYAKRYSGFSAEVWDAFDVRNDSDGMTDYFETDRIRVKPDHPLYSQVLAAVKASDAHHAKMTAKRNERWAQRRQLAAA
jgi:hypothetical protein